MFIIMSSSAILECNKIRDEGRIRLLKRFTL